MIIVDRLIDVRQRLGFDALRCVDHQQRTFTGRKRAGHFVGEVDVAGRVDEVQHIGLAVIRLVVQAHGLSLDGDAALALDIHRVENLFRHVAFGKTACRLDQPVGQRRFAVINVGNDREVADMVQGRAGRICAHVPRYSRGFSCRKAGIWLKAF
ncbi:hypothetical protein D3C87_869360 [compost metagenome]